MCTGLDSLHKQAVFEGKNSLQVMQILWAKGALPLPHLFAETKPDYFENLLSVCRNQKFKNNSREHAPKSF